VVTILKLAAAALLVAGLAACGSPEPAAPAATPQTDPCALLTDADAGTHLGGTATHKTDDLPGISRGCRWETTGSDAYVFITLSPEPFPEVKNPKRTLDVGGKPATILAQDGRYCLIYVNGGADWMQFSSQSARASLPDPLPKAYECDRSIAVVTKVVPQAGW
jgi:hypothetical protein